MQAYFAFLRRLFGSKGGCDIWDSVDSAHIYESTRHCVRRCRGLPLRRLKILAVRTVIGNDSEADQARF